LSAIAAARPELRRKSIFMPALGFLINDPSPGAERSCAARIRDDVGNE
jgi:hypothetical protein